MTKKEVIEVKAKKKTVFETLSEVSIKGLTEEKNGLTYLSWALGWKLVKTYYPSASYRVLKSKAMINGCENELNYFTDGHTCWVEVEVTIENITESMYLPVMNFRNQSIKASEVTSVDINKNIQRCLAKNIAVNFGLGICLYAGEDLPEEEPNAPQVKENKPKNEVTLDEMRSALTQLYTIEELDKILEHYHIETLKDLDAMKVASYYKARFK